MTYVRDDLRRIADRIESGPLSTAVKAVLAAELRVIADKFECAETPAPEPLHKISVPSKVYHDCIDGSGVPSEENWPKPQILRRGKGCSYIYLVPKAMADLILSHVLDSFEARQGYETAAEDRAPYFQFLRRYGLLR